MVDNFEELIKKAVHSDCPDDELLGLYAEDKLAGPDKEMIEKHLDKCPPCKLVVQTVRESEASKEKVVIAESLKNKIKALAKPVEELQPAAVGNFWESLKDSIGRGVKVFLSPFTIAGLAPVTIMAVLLFVVIVSKKEAGPGFINASINQLNTVQTRSIPWPKDHLFNVSIELERDSYVYMFGLDEKNRAELIYSSRNPLKGRQVHRIPEQKDQVFTQGVNDKQNNLLILSSKKEIKETNKIFNTLKKQENDWANLEKMLKKEKVSYKILSVNF